MNTIRRRTFLKGSVASGFAAVAATSGLLRPTEVLAAAWPKAAFNAHGLDKGIQSLFGSSKTSASKAIKIKAPIQAENGAVVPLSVSTTLSNVEAIGVFVEKNPVPLATSIDLAGATGYYSARIKMGKTSPIHVVVKSGGKLHVAKKTIKVTVGGCGG